MTAVPRSSVVALVVGGLVLTLALPSSPPDGSGRQWDNLALGLLAAVATLRAARAARGLDSRARTPWRLLLVCGGLFSLSGLVTGSGLAPAFGGVGIGDLLLGLAVCLPPVVCVLLARQVSSTRGPTLLVDGLLVTLSLLVVTDLLVFTAEGAGALGPLAVGYGSYAAVAVGLGGALCTVSTRALRQSATAVVVGIALSALASSMLAVSLLYPLQLWQAVGDGAVLLALEAFLLAIAAAPRTVAADQGPRARAPRINPIGLGITVAALFGLPLALLVAVLRGQQPSPVALAGVAAVVALLLVRTSLRVRDSGRLVADLVRTEEDFRELVESSTDGVVIVDGDLRLQFTSRAARSLLGLDDPGAGIPLLDLVDAADRERVGQELAVGGSVLHFGVPADDDGHTDLEVTHHDRPGSDRRVLHLRDVTTRRRRERELERMAYTDHLTRVPNRALLFQEMGNGSAERCLLVLDLDGFKAVNDEAGHEAGDQLLVEVARRLRSAVREQDVVARLGGDEFAVLVEGTLREARDTAQRVVDALAHPHRTAAGTYAVGASVGVAQLHPGGGQLAFREADAALRAAKQAGKGCVRVWDDGRGSHSTDSDVAAALADGQVQLRYTLAGSAESPVLAVHAAPVWVHRTAGTLPAAELWAAGGRQGQSAALQHWLLTTATAEAASLVGELTLAVDLPAGHVLPELLVADVRTALATSGLPAPRLSVAVTEEALATAPASLPRALHVLHADGVRICLDDYGMGQTLYKHLSRIPLDSVRVDLSALGARGDETRALQVLAAITATADAFGITTIVHGVEATPLRDAALATGVRMVRSRATPQLVDISGVRALLAEGAPSVGGR
ncbi:hypothetical protein ASG36_07245 [Geodermatophilus sp. Leaf369]|uniref:diguanylate cyclase domain-containing protein n=1 Tax=Geodermatophilus sp. Leaf369 TaxID=1736354 RepID=UPI0006FA5CE7|nr:diguanylate cyclase [Geodermatophilus sp. Leaf369]KQS60673.1 hypothetical protein ASG36_07245 [Geodermatophilus sp. Leaf369]